MVCGLDPFVDFLYDYIDVASLEFYFESAPLTAILRHYMSRVDAQTCVNRLKERINEDEDCQPKTQKKLKLQLDALMPVTNLNALSTKREETPNGGYKLRATRTLFFKNSDVFDYGLQGSKKLCPNLT